MAELTSLPLEILIQIFSYLELTDLFHICSTCRHFHESFRPDCLIKIVDHFSEPEPSSPLELNKAIQEASHLVLCHSILHIDPYTEDYDQYEKLLDLVEAPFRHIPVGRELQDAFTENGPWSDETQFLLNHGASLHDVPEGISSLLAFTLFNRQIDDETAQVAVDFLIESGASFHTMPSEYETVLDELAAEKLRHRLLIALRYGGPLKYAPSSVQDELKLAYTEIGLCDTMEVLLSNIPNGLTILLADQVVNHGIGPLLDALIERGASFDDLELGDLPEELPGYQAAAMKAVITGGEALWTPDKSGNHPLYYLAGSGYVGLTKDAIRKGAPVDFRNNDGWTVLYAAASQGHHRVLEVLLEAGADSSILNDRGGSALLSAALHNHVDAVRVLINGGVDLSIPDKDGMTPIFHAIYKGSSESVQLLLDAGVDQSFTFRGWTPIFAAAYHGRYETLEVFLRAGVDPTATISPGGLTPMHGAAWEGHLDCVQLLHSYGVDLMIGNELGATALHNAAEHGHLDIVRWLEQKGVDLDIRTASGASPLHLAAGEGHLDTVKWLLEHGARFDAYDNDGNIPLHHACDCGAINVIDFLLKNGASVNQISKIGHSPLCAAARKGRVEAMEFLLDNGANPDSEQSAKAPLLAAIHSDNPDAVRTLLKAHAAVESRTANGITALQLAAYIGQVEIVKILLEAGADIHLKAVDINVDALHCSSLAGQAEVVEFLLEHGASVHAKAENDETAIHAAAEHGWPAVIALLLEYGSAIDPIAVSGATPLYYAAENGKLDAARVLVERGANVQAKCEGNGTALYAAAAQGHLEVVKLLSEVTKDPMEPDLFSRTALQRAVSGGHWPVAEHLNRFDWDVHLKDGYGRTVLDWAAMDGNAPEWILQRCPQRQEAAWNVDTGHLHRSICYLSKRLLEMKRRQTIVGFLELGHCMLLLGKEKEAKICFQNLIVKVDPDDGKLQHNCPCVLCPEDASNPTGIFHVCTTCAGCYLCDNCVRPEVLREKSKACQSHTFLEIKEPPEVLGKEIPLGVRQWLEDLITQYEPVC